MNTLLRSPRTQRFHFYAATIFTASILLSACSNGSSNASSNSDNRNLSISIAVDGKSPAYWAEYMAQELGYFRNENLTVNILTVGEDSTAVRGLVSGSLEAAIIGPDSVIRANQQGSNLRIAANDVNPLVNSLNVSPDIRSWSALKGKAIATQGPDAGSTLALLAMLGSHGLTDKDVTLLKVGNSAARFAALKAGQVAAAVTSQPADIDAARKGYPILGRSTDNKANTIEHIVAIKCGLTGEKKESVKRFAKAIARAAEWTMNPTNKNLAIAKLQKVFGESHEDATAVYHVLVEDAKFLAGGVTPSFPAIQQTAQLMTKYSGTQISIDLKSLIQPGYTSSN